MSSGNTNEEIADQLFLSKDTIRTHRNRIFQKVGIRCLPEAIQYARAFDLM